MNENEIWRPVVGYEGLYEVSNTGRVRSLYDGRWQRCRIKELKPGAHEDGYLLVSLYKDSERKIHTVHSLVMAAFVGPRPEGLQINHIDEDKTNNRVENLEYCTCRENNNHGTRNQRSALSQSMPVLEFDEFADLAWKCCWPSTMEAGRSGGYDIANVCRCCKGRCKTHHGKIFRHVPAGKDADWGNWSIRDL